MPYSSSKSTDRPSRSAAELSLVEDACRAARAIAVRRATSEAERDDIWHLRRELSPALRKISTLKLNNDVVVPRGRVPELFALVDEIRKESGLTIASFGHAGDGNIHVNIMLPEGETQEQRAKSKERGERAVRRLFEGVVALGGLDQRRARHRVHEGALSGARIVTGRDRR